MDKPKDGVEFKIKAVKNVINKNSVSVEIHDAKVLVSEEQGTLSIFLQTSPQMGIAIRIDDMKYALNAAKEMARTLEN